jgi:GTPase SAR1 family protein
LVIVGQSLVGKTTLINLFINISLLKQHGLKGGLPKVWINLEEGNLRQGYSKTDGVYFLCMMILQVLVIQDVLKKMIKFLSKILYLSL